MNKNIVWIDSNLLERFMADVFRALGVPDGDAAICADVLITADRRGIDSHGIGRMRPFYYERIRTGIQEAVTHFEVVREGPATAVVAGNNGMGQVIGERSMQIAIDKAREYGMGMVAAKNSTHYGIAGYYLIVAAERGYISRMPMGCEAISLALTDLLRWLAVLLLFHHTANSGPAPPTCHRSEYPSCRPSRSFRRIILHRCKRYPLE